MSVTDHRITETTVAAWHLEQQGHDLPDLTNLFERPAWMAEGACRGSGVNFHPDRGEVTTARQVCADCTVRGECLEFAILNECDDGYWGGTSARERVRLRRQRRAA